VYPAPALSAQPSPVVAAGGNVTLTCSSRDTAGTFYLLKEGGADPPRQRNASFLEGRHQALFPVGPANPSHEVTYRCYHESQTDPYVWSAPSTPLRLEVTGEAAPAARPPAGLSLSLCPGRGAGPVTWTPGPGHRAGHREGGENRAAVAGAYGEPSLWAEPGAPVLPGGSLTLRCGAQAGFGRFALARGEGPPRRLDGQRSPDFPLGPVSRTHGGRYRCYGGRNLSHAWSAPSAPLDVLIAGAHEKPSLSALPGPVASPGENVTLRCRSAERADTFYLSKEGAPGPPQRLRVQDAAAPSQARFTLSAVGPAHRGTYRCYSSHSSVPFALSLPSEPLELRVSGEAPLLSRDHSGSGPGSPGLGGPSL
ncbi:Leukocyte immunoglobulin-like receptor subfamily A member 6, partial [Galemys pyrenaicus]